MKCQLARDNEVRYALQRGRLEAERTQLLVKLVEAAGPAPPVALQQPTAQPAAAISPEEMPARARPFRKPSTPPKPDGTPTTRQMITTVLEHFSPKFLQPKQIEAVVRQEWWPDVPPHRIASCAWDMAKHGLVEKRGSRYRAKPNGHAPEAVTTLGNGAAR